MGMSSSIGIWLRWMGVQIVCGLLARANSQKIVAYKFYQQSWHSALVKIFVDVLSWATETAWDFIKRLCTVAGTSEYDLLMHWREDENYIFCITMCFETKIGSFLIAIKARCDRFTLNTTFDWCRMDVLQKCCRQQISLLFVKIWRSFVHNSILKHYRVLS